MSAFRTATYLWRGGEEWMLARGPESGPQVLLIAPLFEEANLTRGLLVAIGRGLADQGIGSWLPDLPGTGESLAALEEVGWGDWRAGVAAAAAAVRVHTGGMPYSCAFRGGALLDDALPAPGHWRCAPADGAALLRHLERAQAVSDHESGVAVTDAATVAGYPLSATMRVELANTVPAELPHRTAPAIAGVAPWRRAEPIRDNALAERLTDDIVNWVRTCAGR